MGNCAILIEGQLYEIGSQELQSVLKQKLQTEGVLINRDLNLLKGRQVINLDYSSASTSIKDIIAKSGILFKRNDVQQKNRLQIQYRNMSKYGIMTLDENIVSQYLMNRDQFINDYGHESIGGLDIVNAIDSFISMNKGRNISISEITKSLLAENNKLGLHVSNVQKTNHEIVFPKIGQTSFMLDDDVQVSQINESYFKQKLINKLSPPVKLMGYYNYFLRSDNGEHLYILVKNSDEYQKLDDGRLVKPSTETYVKKLAGDKSITMISERNTGEDIMPMVDPDVEYRELTVNGIKHKYLVIPNNSYLNIITDKLVRQKGTEYVDVVNPYTVNTKENTLAYLKMMMTNARSPRELNKYKAKINLISLYSRGSKGINTPTTELIEYINEALTEFNSDPESITLLRDEYIHLLTEDPEKYKKLKIKIDALDSILAYMNQSIDFATLSPQDFTDMINSISSAEHILKTKFIKDVGFKTLGGLNINTLNQLMMSLANDDDLSLERKIARNATELNSSFKMQLNMITARIPGQDKQSFQSTNVVAFLNTKSNLALVNLYNYWLTGADNDIDKIYNMTYYVGKNGKIVNWSDSFRYDDEKFLDKSLELPVPDQTTFTGILDHNGYTLSASDLNIITTVIRNGIKRLSYDEFSRYVEIMNGLYTAEWKYSLTPDIDINNTSIIDELIMKFNSYDDYKGHDGSQESKAIINKYIKFMFQSSEDIANQAHHYSPIEIEITKAAAKKSAKGAAEKTVDFYDPTKIAEYKNINADGKDVIGITATGLKIYGALTMYYFKKIMTEDFAHMNFKQPLVTRYSEDGIDITVNGISTAIASLNVESITPEFLEKYIQFRLNNSNSLQSQYNAEEINFIMQTLNLQERASLILSALLSAATDNAKELVLTKINAGPDMASLYIYAILTGYDFEEFANLMISPEADFLVDMWKPMILDETKDNRSPGANLSNPENITDYIFKSSLGKTINRFKLAKTISIKFPAHTILIEGQLKALSTIATFIANAKEEEVLELLTSYDDNIQYSEDEFKKAEEESEDEEEETETEEETEEEEEDDLDSENEMDDLGYDDEVAAIDANKKMKIRFARFFEEVKKTLEKTKSYDPSKINKITELHKSASILKVIGGILKINQGVEADPYSFLNKLDLINKYMGKNINDDNRYAIDSEFYIGGTFYFDFIKFLTNEEYKNKSIDLFSKLVPDNYNVLDIVDKSEHFKAMLNSIVAMHKFYMETSYRYRILYNTVNGENNLYKDNILAMNDKQVKQSINEVVYQGIDKFISQMIIQNYFESGSSIEGESSGSNIKVTIPAGNFKTTNNGGFRIYVNDKKSEIDFTSELNTLSGRIEFIKWMENEVFPNLVMGRRRMADGEMVVDKNLLSNIFISELSNDIISDRVTGDSYEYYKPGMNLLNIKSQEDKNKFEQYKNDFSALNNLNYFNTRVTDLIYLYNLIVNNDAFSKSSFTAMYEKTGSMLPSSSLYYEFKNFVESMDSQVQDDIHNYQGIQFYGVSEHVDMIPKKIKDISKKYLKTRNEKGGIVYYEAGSTTYDEIVVPSDISEKYMLIQRESDFSISKNITTKRSVDKFLSDFLSNGIFDYDINCE